MRQCVEFGDQLFLLLRATSLCRQGDPAGLAQGHPCVNLAAWAGILPDVAHKDDITHDLDLTSKQVETSRRWNLAHVGVPPSQVPPFLACLLHATVV